MTVAATPGRRTPRWSRRALPGVLVAGLVLALAWLLFNGPSRRLGPVGQGAHAAAAVILIPLALVAVRGLRQRGAWVVAGLVSLGMAAMRTVGAHWTGDSERPYVGAGWGWPLEMAVNWLVLLVGCAAALRLLVRRRAGRTRPLRGWRVWAVAVLAQLLCWTPYLLLYWPGILVRDSWSSVIMGSGIEPMGNHHPVLFSLWVGACMGIASWFGSGTSVGVAIFSITQAAVLALGLGAVAVWVRARVGRAAGWAACAFFALDPAIALWSITMHKDTMFVLWATWLTILLVEVARRGLAVLRRPAWLGALAFLLLAISFTRNNGPYVAAAVVVVVCCLALPALFTPRRMGWSWWRIPLVAIAALVVVGVVQGPVYRASGVIPSGRTESLGLQLHQVGWVVRYGHLEPEQEAVLAQVMPLDRWREVYQPRIIDSVKFDKDFNRDWLEEHSDELTQIWLDLMGGHSLEYAKAWYGVSGGYLDPQRVLIRMDPGTERGNRGLVHVDARDLLSPLFGVTNLREAVPRVEARVVATPGLDLAYRTPLLVWLSILAAAAALLRRRPVSVLPSVPYAAVAATLMIASPLTDFRYLALGHVGLPVLLAAFWLGPQRRARLPRPPGRGATPEGASGDELPLEHGAPA